MKLAKLLFMLLIAPLFLLIGSSEAVGQQYQSQSSPLDSVNVRYANGVSPGYAPCGSASLDCPTTTGLNLHVSQGTAICGNVVNHYNGGTISLTNAATNFVFLNLSSCVVSSNTTGFTSGEFPIAVATVSGGVILTLDDVRTFFNNSSGSISGSGTIGYYALFSGSGTIGIGNLDDGITNPGAITSSEPFIVAATSGPSQVVMTYNTGHATSPLAGSAIYSVDSVGNAQVSENGAAVSRLCTVANGECPSGTAVDVMSDQRATGSSSFHTKTEYLLTSGTTTTTLLSQSGSGVVSSINFVYTTTNACTALGSSIIKITINGEGSPYINMPADAFFGGGYTGCSGSTLEWNNIFFGGAASGCSYNAGQCNASFATSASYYSRIPIPFNNGITITITTAASGTLFTEIKGDTATDNFPYTQKLWVQYACLTASDTTLCTTPTGGATPYYGQEQLVNYAGSNPGRYVGTYFLNDDTPGSATPKFAALEGNYRIFVDTANNVWVANQATTSSYTIMDPNGNLQTANTGTTGGTIPSSWGCYTGATTTDNTTTWTATVGEPANAWRASQHYSLACMSVLDTNGNVETIVTTGISGASAPSWPSTGSCAGTNTTDNTAVWKCSLGSSMVAAIYQSSGTEDYFLGNNYFNYWTSGYQSPGLELGVNFPYASGGGTVAAYRFYKNEPIRFQHSLFVYRENGDSSNIVMTGGTTTSLQSSWFYTQDTN